MSAGPTEEQLLDVLKSRKPHYLATVVHQQHQNDTVIGTIDTPMELDEYLLQRMREGYMVG
jgi:hypothetical protein